MKQVGLNPTFVGIPMYLPPTHILCIASQLVWARHHIDIDIDHPYQRSHAQLLYLNSFDILCIVQELQSQGITT